MSNPFSGMGSVLPQGEFGKKCQSGFVGDWRVKKITIKNSQQGLGLLYICEAEVFTSNMQQDAPGESRSWVQKMRDENISKPAVKAFMHAILGVSGDVETQKRLDLPISGVPGTECYLDKLLAYSFSEANPFEGWYIRVETQNKPTKARFDFLLHTFRPFNYQAVGASPPPIEPVIQAAMAHVPQAMPAQPQGTWNPGAAAQYGPPQGYQPQQAPSYGPPPGAQQNNNGSAAPYQDRNYYQDRNQQTQAAAPAPAFQPPPFPGRR